MVWGKVAADFERTSGHKLIFEYGSTPRIKQRAETEAADLTINERYVLDDLIKQIPRMLAERQVEGVIAVDTPMRFEPNLPTVNISGHEDVAGVTNVILNHPRAACCPGRHLMSPVRPPRIGDQVKPKIKLTQGGDNSAKLVPPAGLNGRRAARNFMFPEVAMLEPLPDIPGIKFLMVAGVIKGAPQALPRSPSQSISPRLRVGVLRANGMEPYN